MKLGAAILSLALMVIGCRPAVSHSELIVEYENASCTPVMQDSSPTHTRTWQNPLTLTDGSKVMVIGTQSPGGRIDLNYLDDGKSMVAADAGDYVYPADVRTDLQRNLLYVMASGLAGGFQQETWLFQYDLRRRRLLQKQKVNLAVLSSECPAQR